MGYKRLADVEIYVAEAHQKGERDIVRIDLSKHTYITYTPATKRAHPTFPASK